MSAYLRVKLYMYMHSYGAKANEIEDYHACVQKLLNSTRGICKFGKQVMLIS